MAQGLRGVSPVWLVLLGLMTSFVFPPALSWGMGFGGSDPEPVDSCPAPADPLIIQPGPLGSPLRIDWLPPQRLLVTDYPSRQVFLVDSTNVSMMAPAFKLKGNPLGIAVAVGSRANLIFVGNDTRKKVDVYINQKNNFYQTLSFPRRGNVQPVEMVYVPEINRLIMIDGLDGRIKFFNLLGHQVGSFDGGGNLNAPVGLAVDATRGEVVVSDYGDPAVGISASLEIFDFSGSHLKSIEGDFSRPQGMVCQGGKIFVADGLRGQILEFDRSTGNLEGTHGCFGTGPGQLLMPLDLVYSTARSSLLVTNNKNGRVTEVPVAE